MGKMIWPHHLTVYYPHPGSALPIWQAAGAALLLICVSIVIMRASRQQPYLLVGWLWYLGTLVPVIGLVQVGTQAMADRYTYVPLIGLFIIIAWGFPDLLEKWRHRRIGLDLLAGAVLLISMICTWKQLHHWRNSITIWQHALSVTQNNYLAHENLGIAFAEQGRFEEAIAQQRKATQIMPNSAEAHNNLAVALAQQGRFTEAVTHYYEVLRLRPDTAEAHNNLGNAMVELGKIEAAVDHYLRAIQLEPQYAEAYNNLGNALAEQRKLNEAIAHYAQALRIKPTYAKAHNNLGVALARQGRFDEAIARFKKALELQPEYAQARNNLEIAVQDKIKANEKFDTMSKP
jgi:tetratricopeptide (TPR) repeat protein